MRATSLQYFIFNISSIDVLAHNGYRFRCTFILFIVYWVLGGRLHC